MSEDGIQEKAARELQPTQDWVWIKSRLPELSTKVDIVAIDKQGNLSIEYDSWVRRHPEEFVAWLRVYPPAVTARNSPFEECPAPNQERQTHGEIRTLPINDYKNLAPICAVCNSDLIPKKGYVDGNGGNVVTWICRDCGRRVEINHGQYHGQAVYDDERTEPDGGKEDMAAEFYGFKELLEHEVGKPDAEKPSTFAPTTPYDYFFWDVFGMRCAKVGTKTQPKSVKDTFDPQMSHDADNDAQYTKSP